MKVNIDYKGTIVITPENPMEYFALLHLNPKEMCKKCGSHNLPVIIECGECGPVNTGILHGDE